MVVIVELSITPISKRIEAGMSSHSSVYYHVFSSNSDNIC